MTFVMIGHNDFCNDRFVMTGHNDSESHKTEVRGTQVKQDSSQTTLNTVL